MGVIARGQLSHPDHCDWTPISRVFRSFQCGSDNSRLVERKQFPLSPAEAITIHKSKGLTYESVAVHLTRNMKRAALYVACSRATTASGLHLIGNFKKPSKIDDNQPLKLELDSLRSRKLLQTTYKFLETKNDII